MTQTFGSRISALRKEKGMTQSALAEKMGVTDKAVSKWERDLSFPDVGSLPKLAQIFELTVDELLQGTPVPKAETAGENAGDLVRLILKGVALAMGVAAAVLSFLNAVEPAQAVSMLGIGLACLSVLHLLPKAE